MTKYKRLKVIIGYAAAARFWAELSDENGDIEVIGFIPRQTEVPSPYCYSPFEAVFQYRGEYIFVSETKHRRYEVFVVPESVHIYKTEDEATEIFVKGLTS